MKKGGATAPQGTIPVTTYANQSAESVKTHAALTQHAAGASNNATNKPQPVPPPIQSTMGQGISTNAANPPANGMQGGARTRYHRRRLRYKKSMARKSRRA
jgi:hypothetical protein